MAAMNPAQILQWIGVNTRVRGFVKAVTSETQEFDDNGKKKTKQVHKIVCSCGKLEAAVKYDPEEFKAVPPEGAVVEIICEQGMYNGKPFFNRPTACRIVLNPDGSEPAKA